jgi:hypothetical protein
MSEEEDFNKAIQNQPPSERLQVVAFQTVGIGLLQ